MIYREECVSKHTVQENHYNHLSSHINIQIIGNKQKPDECCDLFILKMIKNVIEFKK